MKMGAGPYRKALRKHRRPVARQSRLGRTVAGGVAVTLVIVLDMPGAAANPVNGTVTSGEAIIVGTGSRLDVIQTSNTAVIDWRGFSIGPQEHTHFQQPSAGATALNRVTGPDPSTIAGRLSATGRLILVNPNGIVFSQGAQVDVNSLIATTSNIADDRFRNGDWRFDRPSPNPTAAVSNAGTITVAETGLAALVAPAVANSGVINARLGKVVLAGTEAFKIDLYGDGLMSFQLAEPAGTGSATAKPSSDPKKRSASNSGTINADGGVVQITAADASGIVDGVVNMSGVVSARTVRSQGGKVVFGSGGETLVSVGGTVDVSSAEAGAKGGEAVVQGQRVQLTSAARIDASGTAGGGRVEVGGGVQGRGTTRNAKRTAVEKGAVIKADARGSGKGGTVAVWSDEATGFAGSISARGGAAGGDGGFVEVSGKQRLLFHGTVDTSAPKGLSGTLLLDPQDITVSSTGTNDGALGATGILFDDGTIGTGADAGFTPAFLSNLTGNVVLQASRDFTIAEAVTFTAADSVSLQAGRTMTVAAAVQTAGSKPLTLLSGQAFDANGSTTGSIVTTAAIGGGGTGAVTLTAGTGGKIQLGAGVTADGALTLNSPVELTAATVALDSTGGGNSAAGADIQLSGTLAGGGNALTLTAGTGGTVTVTGAVSTVGALTLASAAGATFQGALGATTVSLDAATTTAFQGNVTGTVTFGADGTATLADGVTITGNVTTGTAGQGTLRTLAAGGVTGTVGAGAALKTVAAQGSGAVSFTGAVSAGTLDLSGKTAGGVTVGGTLTATTLTTAAAAYGIALNGGGTITNATTFANTGSLTLGDGAGDSLTFTGSVTATAPSSKSLAGTVATTGTALDLGGTGGTTLTAAAILSAGNGTVTPGTVTLGAVTAGANDLTVTGAGVSLSGALTGTGTLTLQPDQDATSIGLGGGAGTFSLDATALGRIGSGFSSVVVGRSTGTHQFTLGSFATDASLSLRGGPVTIDGTITTVGKALSFGGNVTLSANSSIDTTNGGAVAAGANIQFGSVSGGGKNLTLNAGTGGTVTVTGAVSNVDTLTLASAAGATFQGTLGATTVSLDAATTTAFQGNVTGTVTFGADGTATLADGVTITGNVTTGTAGQGTLRTLAAGGVTGTVGAGAALKTVAAQGSGAVSFTGAVSAGTLDLSGKTAGGVTVGGTLTATTLTTAAAAYGIALNGGGTITNATTFANTGSLTLGDGAGDSLTFTGSVTATAPSSKSLAGTVATTGTALDLGGTGGTTLTAATILSAGNGTVTPGTVTLGAVTAGANDLTVTGAGVSLSGALTGTGTLTLQPDLDTTSIGLGDGAGTFSLDATALGRIGSGFSSVVVGRSTGTHQFTLGNFTTNAPLSLRGGSFDIGGTITTVGKTLSFGGNVTLTADSSINTTNGGAVAAGANIQLSGTLAGGGHDLTLTAGTGGTVTVTGAVSNVDTLTLASAAGATFQGTLGATTVRLDAATTTAFQGNVTGTVTFGADGTATLADGVTITGNVTTGTSGQGTLTFAGAGSVSGQIGGPLGLLKAINAGADGKTVTLGGDAYATTTTVTGSGTLALSGSLTGTTLAYGGDGTVTLADGKSITGAVTTGTPGQGTLTFAGAGSVSGGVGATTNWLKAIDAGAAGKTVTLGGDAYATATTVTGSGTLALSGSLTGTTLAYGGDGTVTVAGGKSIDANVTASDGSGTLIFQGSGGVGGSVGATGALKRLQIGGGGTFGGAVSARAVAVSGGGELAFNASVDTGSLAVTKDSGSLTIRGRLAAGSLSTGTGGYDIALLGGGSVSDTMTFANSGTLQLGDGTDDAFTFAGGVAATLQTKKLAGRIDSSNSFIDFSGAATTLVADTVLSSGTGATVLGQVNAASAGGAGLTVGGSGSTQFNGTVGATAALSNLTTGSGSAIVNAASIRTTGNQSYGGGLTLSAADVALTSTGGALSVAGSIAAAATASRPNLTVEAAGDISISGAVGGARALGSMTVLRAANLTVGGGMTLSGLAQEAGSGLSRFDGAISTDGSGGIRLTAGAFQFGGSLSTAGGPLSITAQGAQSLSISTDFDAGSGAIVLTNASADNSRTGSIEQTAGILTGASLTGTARSLSLGKDNRIGELAGYTVSNGSLLVNAANSLTVSAPVSAAGGDLSLTAAGSGSALTVNGALTAADGGIRLEAGGAILQNATGAAALTGRTLLATGGKSGTGRVELTNAGNSIGGTVAGTALGDFSLVNRGSIALGTLSGVGGINASGSTATIRLKSLTGGISQTAGGVSAANLLALAGGGSVLLDGAANAITGALAGSAAATASGSGQFRYTGTTGFVIAAAAGLGDAGTIAAASGIEAAGANGIIVLRSQSGDIGQQSGAALRAEKASITAATGGISLTGEANRVAVLTGEAGGNFAYLSATDLTLDSFSTSGGAATNAMAMQRAPGFAAAAPESQVIIRAGDALELTTVNGNITQSAGSALSANRLLVRAGGAGNVTLTNESNRIGTVSGGAGGTFSLRSTGNMTVGTVGGVAGLTVGGNADIRTEGGLTLDQSIHAGDKTFLRVGGSFRVPGSASFTSDLVIIDTSGGTFEPPAFGVNDPPRRFLDEAKTRTSLSGDIALGRLSAPNSTLLLFAGHGAITGAVNLKGLGIAGMGGSASLTGTIGGHSGTSAAQYVMKQLPRENSYKFNGCAVGGPTCVVLPPFEPVRPDPTVPVLSYFQNFVPADPIADRLYSDGNVDFILKWARESKESGETSK